MSETKVVATMREPSVDESIGAHPAWFRLNDQRQWYDAKSQHCQRWYKRLKFVQVSLAVLIPSAAMLPDGVARWGTSIAGTLIALLEAVQQLNQYSTLWVSYRGTAERLKHEQYLFLSTAGPYKGMTTQDSLVALAERVEELISTEHGGWSSEAGRRSTGDKPGTS